MAGKGELYEEIVLLADRTYGPYDAIDISGKDLEKITDEYFEDISNGLKSLCKHLFHYDSPKVLIENIYKHKNSLVFTVFGGSDSRNRMALVPAICESYGIRFVGADAYSRIVCQDKFLSKVWAERFGIRVAKGVLIDKTTRVSAINQLSLPLVIKPNLEGSSIGISEKSLIGNYLQAEKMIEAYLKKFKQPILAEEFIPGREVCICIAGSLSKIDFIEAMEVVYESDDTHFYKKLYTSFDKHLSDENIIHRRCTHLLKDTEVNALNNLYLSLGKMDFMRIDGRINENGFTLVELTPDAYIGKNSAIANAGQINGFQYSQLLDKIIRNALEYYRTPYSSYTEN